jgi:hypothetical protein
MKYPAAIFVLGSVLLAVASSAGVYASDASPPVARRSYAFDGKISREVLENYLSRAISVEGILNGHGDLNDNIRMLTSTGAKYIGRSLCLWGGEGNFLKNMDRARTQAAKCHEADPDMILEACIFEIVTTQVDQVPVPEWAFAVLGQPVEKRNFKFADMIYEGRQRQNWGGSGSVPDVSRPETKLWFYTQAASYIDAGFEGIHFGQVELMNKNDKDFTHWSQVFTLVRDYAAKHARRHMILLNAHTPGGGLVKNGNLLLDFHAFPLRIKEKPNSSTAAKAAPADAAKPQEAILEVGHSDSLFGRSKGGVTPSGWKCEHLPYLVELDNYGVSGKPGQPGAGGIWVWGYDEITWFAHQPKEYRAQWLKYAWDWVRKADPNGFLQMPGSRTMAGALNGKRWYFANNPSPAMPDGLGDEDAIRAIWAAAGAN